MNRTLFVVLLASAAVAPTVAYGQSSPGPHEAPCVGQLQFTDVDSVDSSSVRSLDVFIYDRVVNEPDPSTGGRKDAVYDGIALRWEASGPETPLCFWIGMKGPSHDDFPALAIALLEPSAKEFLYVPVGEYGQFCFRVTPVLKDAPGESAEGCVEVKRPEPLSANGESFPQRDLLPPEVGNAAAPAEPGEGLSSAVKAALAVALGVSTVALVFARRRSAHRK